MSTYMYDNENVRVFPSDIIDLNTELRTAVYSVKMSANVGYYLNRESDNFKISDKVYGDIYDKVDMIIDTYMSRARDGFNTGVLFSGVKGSGKTLSSKIVCNKMLELGYPVIMVKERFDSDGLVSFLESIDDQCVILFDEFEKVFSENNNDDTSSQRAFLTFLDGVVSTSHLILFTCNDVDSINDYLLNRPGRIYYHLRYNNLSDDIFTEYCEDNLDNKEYETDIRYIMSIMDDKFSFDILQMIVKECNYRKKSPKTFIDMLNVSMYDEDIDAVVRIECNIRDVHVSSLYTITDINIKSIEDNNVNLIITGDEEARHKLCSALKENTSNFSCEPYGDETRAMFYYKSDTKYWFDEKTHEFVFEPVMGMKIIYSKKKFRNFKFF